MLKKILSIVLVIVIMLSLFMLIPCSAEANSAEEFEYDFIGDGTVYITKYKGNSKEVVIPSTVEGYTVSRIGNSIFSQSNNVYSVVVPDSVDTLEEHAFYNLSNLKTVTLGNNLKTIKQQAFSDCSNLHTINFPDTITSVEIGAFSDTGWYFDQPDGLVYIGKVAYKYKGDCPQSISIKKGTTEISGGAFYGCSSLFEVTIPYGVTSIGTQAFLNCTDLSMISIPDSVNCIGTEAFDNTAWDNRNSDGLNYLGKVAYKYKGKCPKDVSVNIGTKGIAGNAFKGCTDLESISVPDGIEVLGDYCFCGCKALKTIELPKTVYDIGECAFELCEVLDHIHIPEKVTVIKGSVFSHCYQLNDITLPSSITKIDRVAFKLCENLKSFIFPKKVKYIGYQAFNCCRGLKKIYIPDSVTYLGFQSFAQCSNLTNIRLPSSIKEVMGFDDCDSLTSVNIPSGATTVGGWAFRWCNQLTVVTIPKSVTKIDDRAFDCCSKITDVYYEGSEEEWKKISIGIDNYSLNNIHYESTYSPIVHTITSDYADNHTFSFSYDEEIEDLVFSQSSTEYNPRLAHFLGCMARSAYTPDLAKKNYAELGFTVPEEQHFESGDPIAGFYVGDKQMDDGKKLVMITIRGTDDWSEWLGTNFNFGDSAMINSVGLHSGFCASAVELYNYLADCYGETPLGDIKFVITGHSLGAAVGNILAKLLSLGEVPNDCLYAYNFACPNVGMGSDDISAWNNNGEHNNIINIGNWCDQVSHEPGLGIESLSYSNRHLCLQKGWNKWKRFGVSYWFDNGWQFLISHDMGVYLDYLEKEYDETHFRDKEYEVKAISAHCPVDVIVYDNKGNPIAGTTNNEPNYCGYEPGEKALVFVDGDRKLFHVFNNEAYEVKLVGTDIGEMEYGVSTGDMTSGDIYTDKWFESVPLTTGKQMLGKTVNILDEETKTITREEKLLLMDGQGNTDTEILTNGEETDYTIKYILGDADNNGSIDIIDATFIQRKLADIATPYTDEILQQGDADGSGELDVIDVTMIQRYLVEIKTPYLIGTDVV